MFTCPDPTLSQGKGSGEWWLLSNFLVVLSQQYQFWTSKWMLSKQLHVVKACIWCLFKIDTADSAQPRNCSIVIRPFSLLMRGGLGRRLPHERAGSGHETTSWEVGVWARDYLMRGWGLGTRLPRERLGSGHETTSWGGGVWAQDYLVRGWGLGMRLEMWGAFMIPVVIQIYICIERFFYCTQQMHWMLRFFLMNSQLFLTGTNWGSSWEFQTTSLTRFRGATPLKDAVDGR